MVLVQAPNSGEPQSTKSAKSCQSYWSSLSVEYIGVVGSNLGLARDIFQNMPAA